MYDESTNTAPPTPALTPHASIARYSKQRWQRRKTAVSVLGEVGSKPVVDRLKSAMRKKQSKDVWTSYHGGTAAASAAAAAMQFGGNEKKREGWDRSSYEVPGTNELEVATRMGLYVDVSAYSPTLDEEGGVASFVDKTDWFPPHSDAMPDSTPAPTNAEWIPTHPTTNPTQHPTTLSNAKEAAAAQVLIKGPLYIRLVSNTASGPVWNWSKRWFAIVGHYLRFASDESNLIATMHLPVHHHNKLTQESLGSIFGNASTSHADRHQMPALYDAVDLRGLLLPTSASSGAQFYAPATNDGGDEYRPFFAAENRLSLRFVLPTSVPKDIPSDARGATRIAGLTERASVLVLQAPTESEANKWDRALQKVAAGVYHDSHGADHGEESDHPYLTRSDYDPHSLPVFVAVAVLPSRRGIADGTHKDGHDPRIKFASSSSHLYATHTHTSTDDVNGIGEGGAAMGWDPLLAKHNSGEGSRAEGAFLGFRSYIFTAESPSVADQQGWRIEYIRFTGDFSLNCVTGDWSSWDPCGASCGGSTQRRTRSVLQRVRWKGKRCGAVNMKRPCAFLPCPVDCKLGSWSKWGPSCYNVIFRGRCHHSFQYRERKLLTKPEFGGKQCDAVGMQKQSRGCNFKPCAGIGPSHYCGATTSPTDTLWKPLRDGDTAGPSGRHGHPSNFHTTAAAIPRRRAMESAEAEGNGPVGAPTRNTTQRASAGKYRKKPQHQGEFENDKTKDEPQQTRRLTTAARAKVDDLPTLGSTTQHGGNGFKQYQKEEATAQKRMEKERHAKKAAKELAERQARLKAQQKEVASEATGAREDMQAQAWRKHQKRPKSPLPADDGAAPVASDEGHAEEGHESYAIYTDVNTDATCGHTLSDQPVYTASIVGLEADRDFGRLITGIETIVNPTRSGFRLVLSARGVGGFRKGRMTSAELLSRATLAGATGRKWSISWIAAVGSNVGMTTAGMTGWKQDADDPMMAYADIDASSTAYARAAAAKGQAELEAAAKARGTGAVPTTEAAKVSQAPVEPPQYFPVLMGSKINPEGDQVDAHFVNSNLRRNEEDQTGVAVGWPWQSTGMGVLYTPTANGFRVIVRAPFGSLPPGMAFTPHALEAAEWVVGWIGVPPTAPRHSGTPGVSTSGSGLTDVRRSGNEPVGLLGGSDGSGWRSMTDLQGVVYYARVPLSSSHFLQAPSTIVSRLVATASPFADAGSGGTKGRWAGVETVSIGGSEGSSGVGGDSWTTLGFSVYLGTVQQRPFDQASRGWESSSRYDSAAATTTVGTSSIGTGPGNKEHVGWSVNYFGMTGSCEYVERAGNNAGRGKQCTRSGRGNSQLCGGRSGVGMDHGGLHGLSGGGDGGGGDGDGDGGHSTKGNGKNPWKLGTWQQYGLSALYIDVDASYCLFPSGSTPAFAVSVRGDAGHWQLTGTSAVVAPTRFGFRVIVEHPSVRGRPLLQAALEYKWAVHWVGDAGDNSGSTAAGQTGWDSLRQTRNATGTGVGGGLSVKVGTRACDFNNTGRYPIPPRYFATIQGGAGAGHWRLQGAHILHRPTRQGFELKLHYRRSSRSLSGKGSSSPSSGSSTKGSKRGSSGGGSARRRLRRRLDGGLNEDDDAADHIRGRGAEKYNDDDGSPDQARSAAEARHWKQEAQREVQEARLKAKAGAAFGGVVSHVGVEASSGLEGSHDEDTPKAHWGNSAAEALDLKPGAGEEGLGDDGAQFAQEAIPKAASRESRAKAAAAAAFNNLSPREIRNEEARSAEGDVKYDLANEAKPCVLHNDCDSGKCEYSSTDAQGILSQGHCAPRGPNTKGWEEVDGGVQEKRVDKDNAWQSLEAQDKKFDKTVHEMASSQVSGLLLRVITAGYYCGLLLRVITAGLQCHLNHN
jgi:hypothetical protein